MRTITRMTFVKIIGLASHPKGSAAQRMYRSGLPSGAPGAGGSAKVMYLRCSSHTPIAW